MFFHNISQLCCFEKTTNFIIIHSTQCSLAAIPHFSYACELEQDLEMDEI